MKTPKDAYNETIGIGDYISYPVRKGSDMFIRTAKVKDLYEKETENGTITALKVTVAIPPRASERQNNRRWRDEIRYVESSISVSWRATKIHFDKIANDFRYNGLASF